MHTDYFKSLNDFSTQSMNAAKALGTINSKLAEKSLALQIKAADMVVEGTMKQGQLVQETKEVKDYLTKQAGLVEEYAGKFIELAKSNVALAQEAGEQYKIWLESNMAGAGVATEPAAKKAVAKAA